MYIHIRYGSEKNEYVMIFDSKRISVDDVLYEAKKRYGKYTSLQLLNDYNELLRKDKLIERGRSYRVIRSKVKMINE